MTMDYEEMTEIRGCSCTLLNESDNAICGKVVGDYGNDIAVESYDGKVSIYDRNELLIFD